jgi:hypothetical protein
VIVLQKEKIASLAHLVLKPRNTTYKELWIPVKPYLSYRTTTGNTFVSTFLPCSVLKLLALDRTTGILTVVRNGHVASTTF